MRRVTFNLVHIPTTDDTVEADRFVKANRAAGGVLYPVSAFPNVA